jgi:protein TonB
MKRLLLAGSLALLAHGIFFGIKLSERQKPSFMRPVPERLSMSLSYQQAKGEPAARNKTEVKNPPRSDESARQPVREIKEEPEKKTVAAESAEPIAAKNAAPAMEGAGDVFSAPEPPPDTGGEQAGAGAGSARDESTGDLQAAGGQGAVPRTQGAQAVIRKAVPLYERNPSPPYPPRAKKLGMEGTVTLRVLVGENGEALEVQVEQGSGFALLDYAALGAVKKWQFVPGFENGRPVAMWVQVPVRFELRK